MEQDAVAQARDVSALVGMLERLGELGHDLQVRVDVHEGVEEELLGLLRRFVRGDARIEIGGGIGGGDDDRCSFGATAAAGRGDQQQRANRRGRHRASQ